MNDSKLTLTERNDLQYLEQKIESGLQTFIEVGEALWTIREGKLYRLTHDTFEEYCKDRWGISRIHAHRLIQGSEVVKTLPAGNKDKITSERQARELAKVDPENRSEIIERTIEREGKLTAPGIKRSIPAHIAHAQILTPLGRKRTKAAERCEPEEVPKKRKRVSYRPDIAMRAWAVAKGRLETILPEDVSREAALRECVEYCQARLKEGK